MYPRRPRFEVHIAVFFVASSRPITFQKRRNTPFRRPRRSVIGGCFSALSRTYPRRDIFVLWLIAAVLYDALRRGRGSDNSVKTNCFVPAVDFDDYSGFLYADHQVRSVRNRRKLALLLSLRIFVLPPHVNEVPWGQRSLWFPHKAIEILFVAF